MPLKSWSTAAALAALLMLAGCGRSPSEAEPPAPPVAGATETPAPGGEALDATWQGVLPCQDCDGIQTRLRLIADGQGRRYELQESYLATEGGELFEMQGTWTQQDTEVDGVPTVVYQLDTNGASRWFALRDDGALEQMQAPDRASGDALAYRLQRM